MATIWKQTSPKYWDPIGYDPRTQVVGDLDETFWTHNLELGDRVAAGIEAERSKSREWFIVDRARHATDLWHNERHNTYDTAGRV